MSRLLVRLRQPIRREDGRPLTHVTVRRPKPEDEAEAVISAARIDPVSFARLNGRSDAEIALLDIEALVSLAHGAAFLARLTGLDVAELARLSDADMEALGRTVSRLSAERAR